MGLICCGRIEKKALVIDNEIKIQDVVNLTSTTDHRLGDAATFLPYNRGLKGYLSDPANFKPEHYKANIHWTEKEREILEKKEKLEENKRIRENEERLEQERKTEEWRIRRNVEM
jgi:hypothetical protein